LNAGDAIDMGVFGGKGIGCLGALGDSGIADGNAPIPRGDRGGEANEVWDAPARGLRGKAEDRPEGLGLNGRPGLRRGGDTVFRLPPEARPDSSVALRMPAKDPASESDGDKCRICASGGLICTAWRTTGGSGSTFASEPFSAVVGLDLLLLLFFERLLSSASFWAASSRSLSSSSRVFRRPRSVTVGISSTSSTSS
jgi:hypothetical protein